MIPYQKQSRIAPCTLHDKRPPLDNELHYEVRGDTEHGRVSLQVYCGNIRGRWSRKVSTSSFSVLWMFQPRPTKVMVGVIMRDIAGFFKKSDAPKTLHDLVCHAYLRDQYPHLHCGRLGKFANAMDETVFRWLEPHEESVLPKKVVAQVIALHEQLASHQ